LEGAASEAVAWLRLKAVNYNEGSPEVTVSKHMEALLTFEVVTSQYN